MKVMSLEQLARAYAKELNRDAILIQGLNTWSTAVGIAEIQKALPFLPSFEENEGVYLDGIAICDLLTDGERKEAMVQIEALPQRIKNMLTVTEITV